MCVCVCVCVCVCECAVNFSRFGLPVTESISEANDTSKVVHYSIKKYLFLEVQVYLLTQLEYTSSLCKIPHLLSQLYKRKLYSLNHNIAVEEISGHSPP